MLIFKNCKQLAYEDIFKTPHSEENTDTPRVAIVTRDVSGHPVGSRIVSTNTHKDLWKLLDKPLSSVYTHNIGCNCEWEDELVGSAWEQIDHSGARNAGDITTISKISKNAHIHYYDSNSSKYEYFFKVFKKYKPLEAAKPNPATPRVTVDYSHNYNDCVSYTKNPFSPATSCSQPTLKPIPEEETMNPIKENITIAMTADEYAKYQKSNKSTTIKTDLEQAPKWLTIWYDADEREIHQTTQSPKQARKALQKPDSLGHTFRSYLITKSASTAIPVVDIAI